MIADIRISYYRPYPSTGRVIASAVALNWHNSQITYLISVNAIDEQDSPFKELSQDFQLELVVDELQDSSSVINWFRDKFKELLPARGITVDHLSAVFNCIGSTRSVQGNHSTPGLIVINDEIASKDGLIRLNQPSQWVSATGLLLNKPEIRKPMVTLTYEIPRGHEIMSEVISGKEPNSTNSISEVRSIFCSHLYDIRNIIRSELFYYVDRPETATPRITLLLTKDADHCNYISVISAGFLTQQGDFIESATDILRIQDSFKSLFWDSVGTKLQLVEVWKGLEVVKQGIAQNSSPLVIVKQAPSEAGLPLQCWAVVDQY